MRKSPTGLPTMIERLMSRLVADLTSGCWVWQGSTVSGYGRVGNRGKSMLAHRAAYEIAVGPIPDGLQLDHICRNRACCNPDHLEPVTARENQIRGYGASGLNARKTHCKRGHEFVAENTYYVPATGNRQCRECYRIRSRESYNRRVGKVS